MSSASASALKAADPLNEFFRLAKTLMIAVKNVFPECEKTQDALAQLEFIEASNMDHMKEVLIRSWYTTMKPYVQACVQKNDNVILRADIDVLDKLDIKAKWSDPDFDQESKDTLWEYVNTLNYLSCLYNESKPEDVQDLAHFASKLAETAQIEMTEDGKFSFNIKAFESLVTDKSKSGEIANLMSQAGPLMANLFGGGGDGGAPSGLQSLLAAQMSSFSGFFPPAQTPK
jgi:hypothetical protein